MSGFAALPSGYVALAILAGALLAHALIRTARHAIERVLAGGAPAAEAHDAFVRRHPKLATILSLGASALIFVVYFVALGMALGELGVDLTAYVATASVIGLAVAFGSQGLVQDIVIGLTLVFSDAFDVGDVVEISGQIGRVRRMGLRFTVLENFLGQAVYVPNRNIAVVGRYAGGRIVALVDVVEPVGLQEADLLDRLDRLGRALRAQYPGIVLGEPESAGPFSAEARLRRYVRLRIPLWPGQGPLLEGPFRQRVVAAMKEADPEYADWMVTITYREGTAPPTEPPGLHRAEAEEA